MSLNHHGAFPPADDSRDQSDKLQRLMDQINGTARRQYPEGRMGAEDDGVLSYAITNDDRRGTIIIRFGKPVEWIGLGVKEAEELRDQLSERILVMRGVKS